MYALAQLAFEMEWRDTAALIILGFHTFARFGEVFAAKAGDFVQPPWYLDSAAFTKKPAVGCHCRSQMFSCELPWPTFANFFRNCILKPPSAGIPCEVAEPLMSSGKLLIFQQSASRAAGLPRELLHASTF